MAPIRPRPKSRKSQVAIFEIPFFELLVARAGARLYRARQVHLAIAPENFAVAVDQNRTIKAPTVRCQFGVTDIESNAERPGAIEQALHGRIRHTPLVVIIERLALDEPPREEGRKRQFGKNDQTCAARSRRMQELQHPAKSVLSRVRFLRRPHLSSGGAENSDQHCLQSVRIAYSRGG